MPIETIDWDKHDVVECDERGRATLGMEFADERVFVYVARMPDINEDDLEPLPKNLDRTIGKMLAWADDNGIDTMTHLLDPENGRLMDKNGEWHDYPHSVTI